MAVNLRIAIVGPGRLGSTLARELLRRGYRIVEIISRNHSRSAPQAQELARKVRARLTSLRNARLDADIIWLCVPDRAIGNVARELAKATNWNEKIVFHSSGALDSDQLALLREQGAAVASVHPFMTFVHRSSPSMRGVPFGVEGDARALRVARQIVRDLCGEVFTIPKPKKPAYHAWGTFASPLLVALLVTAEHVAQTISFSGSAARRKMLPILCQTLENYAKLGPAGAFSGPIVRGDAAIVRQHLRVLREVPEARKVYKALAHAALRYLPARNRKELQKILTD